MIVRRDAMERFEEALSRLSERERVLLLAMAVTLSTMALAVAVFVVSSRIEALSGEVAAKREALSALSTRGEDYLANAAFNEHINEQLRENTLRLSTFIEARAGRATIPRPREFRDSQQQLDGVTMLTTTASFSAIDFGQIERLLGSIEEADELVFIRKVALTPTRGASDALDLELTLATFRQGEGQ